MDYETEIGSLKRQLRRQRIAGVALAGLLAVGMIAGGAEPEPPAGDDKPLMARKIYTESLTIIDPQGRPRIILGAMNGGDAAAIILKDQDEKTAGVWAVNPRPDLDQLFQVGGVGGSVFRAWKRGDTVAGGVYPADEQNP